MRLRRSGRTTVHPYRSHVEPRIGPYLGRTELSQLTGPAVRDSEDRLRNGEPAPAGGWDVALHRHGELIVGSLGFALSDALERGLVGRDVVRDLRGSRKRGEDVHAERRQRGELKVGFDLAKREIHIRQRAERHKVIGPPKTAARNV